MQTAPHFLSILGPIVAACIAAVVSFLALVISKEQKTSEFRQAWIDGLREDLAEFSANLRRLEAQPTYIDWKAVTARTLKEVAETEKEHALRQDFFAENRLKLAQSRYAIRLRINSAEPDGQALLSQIDNALEAYYSSSDTEGELEKLMALSQPFLKREWERVKRGEPVFRMTVLVAKWLAAIFVTMVLVGVYWGWRMSSAN